MMKKITLLLALVLALSCCLLMLASCSEDGNDTSSAAGTSSTAAASSEEAASSKEASSTAAASSEEATSSEEPEESSEEPEESSEPETSEEEPAAGGTAESTEGVEPSGRNLAEGKTLTGADAVDASIGNYPGNLTDGVCLAEGETFAISTDWLGYYYNADAIDIESKTNAPGGVAQPTLNFGETTEIKAARIHVFLGNFAGIVAPEEITFEYSEDGVNWVSFGTKTFSQAEANDTTVEWVGFTLTEPVSVQYVRVSLKRGGTWTFVDEFEVY